MLLYKVKWPTNCNYAKVLQEHTTYLKKNFGDNVVVVFDTYNDNSIRMVERNRRSQKAASKEYRFTKDMPVTVSKDKFLGNYANKSRFVDFLMEELRESGIECHQENGEADELIVDIAVKDNSDLTQVIVADDVDILVILTARAQSDQEIFFFKPGKLKVPPAHDSNIFSENHPGSAKYLLFAHSFTGSDTTSSFFSKGEKIVNSWINEKI